MPTSARQASRRLQVTLAESTNVADISAAVALGNAARATLGFLPEGAYRDAAAGSTLLLVRDGRTVVGYALYALTQRHVRLVHLCVDQARRGEGIARLLVESISERHRDFPGILARCRHDYGLGDMWIALGFAQLSEAPSRARKGHAIVRWWRDHGHPNLFTRPADGVLVRASIDLNVLRDLVEPTRSEAAASLALVDDQFSDRLELVRTSALDAEIDKLDGDLRRRCTVEAAAMTSVRSVGPSAREAHEELLLAVRRTHPDYPAGPQDGMDLRHVSETIASGLNVFITHDVHLIEVLGKAAEEQRGLRILQPADVIVHIDELVRAEAYRPVSLLQTRYRRKLIGSGEDQQMQRLVNKQDRETTRELQRLVRALAAAGRERHGIYGPDGEVVAAFVAVTENTTLAVPLLRIAHGADADTLARQVLFLLRQNARQTGASVIRVTDPHPSSSAVLAATTEGFVPHNGGYYGFVIDLAAEAAAVEHQAVLAADAASVPRPTPLPARLPAIAAAEIERRWWPARIIDSELPTYLVAIQQSFSRELLGEPRGLFPRESGLGLSREHVYYRSPGGLNVQGPGRILWYMSGSAGRGVSSPALIACSQLDDVVTATPAELHSRFRHLGVWSIEQIAATARSGKAQALRFTNTEIFPHPVGLKRLRQLGAVHAEHLVPQSPHKISHELFALLYREGRDAR